VNNKRRLGRGLEALLGREEGGYEPSSLATAELLHLPVDQIDANPYQPRRYFDPQEISALADSLRQHGMLQPVLVRAVGDRHQLIAGERRLRASIEAHLHEIPARVLELDDQRVFELAMVENLQREDLNAIDKAVAFRDYLNNYGGTQEELAARLGLDRSTVSNFVRLLDLPGEILERVQTNQISQGHARALLGLPDAQSQLDGCHRVIAESLSVRQTEAMVATGVIAPPKPRYRQDPAHPPAVKAPHFLELEQELHERFGTSVLVRARTHDRGQIIIDFNSIDEFDRLSSMIRGVAEESYAELVH
jgi:ParB family chromosome partitioning protein